MFFVATETGINLCKMNENTSESESIKIIDVPVRGLYPTEKKFGIFDRKFSFCEIIQFVFLVITLLIVIGLAVALAAANTRSSNGEADSNSRTFCMSRDCLWQSAYLLDNMNLSADPCDDFYSYVCGNFPVAHPRTDDSIDLTVFQMLANRNTQNVVNLLQLPLRSQHKNTAEWKLKTFFQTCQNAFFSTNKAAAKLVEKINAPLSNKPSDGGLGGWVGLGNRSIFDATTWNVDKFINLLGKAHGIYTSHPFFMLTVEEDVLSVAGMKPAERYVMTISYRNVAVLDAFSQSHNEVLERGYRNFIYQVISQIWSDIGIANQHKSQINKTIDLILEVEMKLAELIKNSGTWNSHLRPIRNLTKTSNNKIFWKPILSSMFGELKDSDIVKTETDEFVINVTKLLTDLTPQQQNAYTVWKVVETFTQDLGFNYINFYRSWEKVLQSGSEDFEQLFDWCFELSINYLGDIVDAEFIRFYFTENDTARATLIANSVKSELRKQITNYSWLTANEKLIAQQKIDTTRDKFGYPKGIIDNDKTLNEFFNKLEVTAGEHFSNLLNVYRFQKDHDVQLLHRPINHTEWPYKAFQSRYHYDEETGELFFSAGILQHPIYDSHIPMYIIFGSMGRIVGESAVSAVEEHTGAYFFPNYTSSGISSWWSPASVEKFKKGAKNCTNYLYEGKPYDKWLGVQNPVAVSYFGDRHLNEMGGLKAAYNGFLDYLNSGTEKEHLLLPGLQADSIHQLFFISYGQTYCFSRTPKLEENFAKFPLKNQGSLPEHLMLNTLMSQFQQFSTVFNCPKNSELVFDPSKQCESY